MKKTDEDGRSFVEYVSEDEDGKSIRVRPSGTPNEKKNLGRERSNSRNRNPSPLQRKIAGTNKSKAHSKEGRKAQKRKERAKHAAEAEEKAEKRRLAEEGKKRAHDEKDRARHARLRHHRTELFSTACRTRRRTGSSGSARCTWTTDDDATSLFKEILYDTEIFFRQNTGDAAVPAPQLGVPPTPEEDHYLSRTDGSFLFRMMPLYPLEVREIGEEEADEDFSTRHLCVNKNYY